MTKRGMAIPRVMQSLDMAFFLLWIGVSHFGGGGI